MTLCFALMWMSTKKKMAEIKIDEATSRTRLCWVWLHIPTRTVSCPVTTRTVSKKFPGNFLKFPKKLRALLPLAHYRKGNFPRFVYYFRLFCSMNSILIKYSYNCNKINMAKFTLWMNLLVNITIIVSIV